MANFEEAIEKTLKYEGGYVNNPNDSGGETKYGISKRAYPNIDIKNLTIDEAKAIYKRDYWDVIKGDLIDNQEVAEAIFDFAVNGGTITSVKLVQEVLKVDIDGIIGTNTLKSLNNISTEEFIAKFKVVKIERYVKLCESNPKNREFFFGWVRRALD